MRDYYTHNRHTSSARASVRPVAIVAIVTIVTTLLLAGCGSSSDDAASVAETPAAPTVGDDEVVRNLQSYLGPGREVMDNGCNHVYSGDDKAAGLTLWWCVVYEGSDVSTYNVAVNASGDVVDASPK